MKEGLEEFLKRIEAKPTNETLIDRFVSLVLEEDGLERILYLKKLVGLLMKPNPYTALKIAALELQEARKEKLTREYEIGALKDVESCFLQLEKLDNAALVREEINKLQLTAAKDNTVGLARIPSATLLDPEPHDEANQEGSSASRQARVHFHLPSSDPPEEFHDGDHTVRQRPHEAEAFSPFPARTQPRSTPTMMPESEAENEPLQSGFDLAAAHFNYNSDPMDAPADGRSPVEESKEFYDRNAEQWDAEHGTVAVKIPGLQVGPNLLETPDSYEPQRPHSTKSVFDSSSIFASSQDFLSSQDTTMAPAHESPGQGRPRMAFKTEGQTPESNSLFQESQHLHFSESLADPVEKKPDSPRAFAFDMDSSANATAQDMTGVPFDSSLTGANTSFDNDEDTMQLNLEELERNSTPSEPAFPPREFDMPPFDVNLQVEPRSAGEGDSFENPFSMGDGDRMPGARNVFASDESGPEDSFSLRPTPGLRDPFAMLVNPFSGQGGVTSPAEPRGLFTETRELGTREPLTLARDSMAMESTTPASPAFGAGGTANPSEMESQSLPAEPRWKLMRDRLRLLTGVQLSVNHVNDFVLRLLGEGGSREEQQKVLSIILGVLDGSQQETDESRFLAFLFEELQPRALHQFLQALKIGEQAVAFFGDHLRTLHKERQLRRMLNVIHSAIVPGLEPIWYQESYRFLIIIWPELGLKGWHWLEKEGPMAFCERLAEREGVMPATLLA